LVVFERHRDLMHMGTINQIKSKLLELEGGAFQRLCDDWLFRKGHENINAIGIMQTTDRVVKGTPDSLVVRSDGDYVFSEYTVQTNRLAKKLEDDINKCFDEQKTGISCEKISEIIICHLGRLTTHEINKLKEMCDTNGIVLNLNGLDAISLSIQNCYPILAEQYLDISLDTGQLLPVDDFIKRFGQNGLTTKIDNKILFQDDALQQGMDSLKKGDFLLVTGAPGVGKTLFAVNLSKLIQSKCPHIKVYCVFDKGADLIRDVTAHFSEPGEYLVFVDDANRLDSRLEYILHYLTENDTNRSFKIIATVRDYARDTVIDNASNYTSVTEQAIASLSDEQIKELVVNLFDIKNPDYQIRIQEVSGGNARLAMMASKVVIETQQIESIQNVISLYDDYFGQNENVKKIIEDEKLTTTACAISLFRKVDKLNDRQMSWVLNVFGIQEEEFWEYVNVLHKYELVDLYEDEVVKISDQVLSTYLFYLSVFEKRYMPFSLIVNNFYPDFKSTIVDALNPVLSAFDHKEIIKEIRSEIHSTFKDISSANNDTKAIEFLNSFWFALPTESLIFAKSIINNSSDVYIDWKKETFETSKDGSDKTPLVSLLSNFRDFTESEMQISFDLMLKHLEKANGSLEHVIKVLTENYSFKVNDWRYGYAVQKYVVDKLIEGMDGGSSYLFARLFILVSSSFLKIERREHRWQRGDSINIITFRLAPDEYLLPVRKSLFSGLSTLFHKAEYKQLVYKIYQEYVRRLKFDGKEMAAADSSFIKDYIVANMDKQEVSDCLLMTDLCAHFDSLEIEYPEQWKNDFTNSTLQLCDVLLEDRHERRMLEMGYEEYSQYRKKQLVEYFTDLSVDDFKSFIEQCCDLHAALSGRERSYSIKMGISMALSAISDTHSAKFPDMVLIYLDYDDRLEINPHTVISSLFSTMTPVNVWSLINSKEYRWKKLWCSSYFSQLPANEVSSKAVEMLLVHMMEAPCDELPTRVDFLMKYHSIETDIFSKVVRALVTRSGGNKYCARPLEHIYSNHSDLFGQWFEIFKADETLTYDAYLAVFKLERYFDHSGEALDLLTIHDKSFLFRLVDSVYEAERWPSSYTYLPELDFLWQRDSFIEDIEQYAAYICKREESSYCISDNLFTKLFTKENGEAEELTLRKKDFVRKTISKNINDIDYVCFIFNAANFMGEGFMRELIELFLENNKNFEDFQKIEYERRTTSWSGSRVPILEREKTHLISILPLLNSVDLLEHRTYVEMQIENKIKHIESEKKRDYLESRE